MPEGFLAVTEIVSSFGAADAVAGSTIVDASAAGYAGVDAAGAASLGGGASVAGGAAIDGASAAAAGTGTAGAASVPSVVKTLGGAAINAGVSTAVGGLLAPKPPSFSLPTAPTADQATKTVTAMPDPLAQQVAEKRSLVEQLARRGRASTILTSPGGGGGKLGG